MLRITKQSRGSATVTLRLEGQIASDWVAVLEAEVVELLRCKKHIVLDFASVTIVDSRGAALLRKLAAELVEIINCSALIRESLLNGQAR